MRDIVAEKDHALEEAQRGIAEYADLLTRKSQQVTELEQKLVLVQGVAGRLAEGQLAKELQVRYTILRCEHCLTIAVVLEHGCPSALAWVDAISEVG